MSHETDKIIEKAGMSKEDVVKMMGKLERDMDAGTQPYVVYQGSRMALFEEVRDDLELVNGQTINLFMLEVILQKQVAHVQMLAVLKKAADATRPAPKLKHSDSCKSFGIRGDCPACQAKVAK